MSWQLGYDVNSNIWERLLKVSVCSKMAKNGRAREALGCPFRVKKGPKYAQAFTFK